MNRRKQVRRTRASAGVALLLLALGSTAAAQSPPITADNWGTVTAPVYDMTQTSGPYARAELFAGPNQFDQNYFHGVLPNGRIVRPVGACVQVGQDPLGIAVTPDSKFAVTTNNDDARGGNPSLQNPIIAEGYSLTVIDLDSRKVVSQLQVDEGALYIGLVIVSKPVGGYTVYASGGADNKIHLFDLSLAGQITETQAPITIPPTLPADQGYVSHYTADPAFKPASAPTGWRPSAAITFPAGLALSPDGRYLYAACNGDNSMAVVDTTTNKVVKQLPAGYFPYGVAVSQDGGKVLVSNEGIEEYKFLGASYNAGALAALTSLAPGADVSSLFYVAQTDTAGPAPKTSSVSVVSVPGGDPAHAELAGAIYEGHKLDALYNVGDTHPSAMAIVRRAGTEIAFVAKANSDSLALIPLSGKRKLPDFNLSPLNIRLKDGHIVHGASPNALAVSPDQSRLYVAEAGIDAVAVLDVSDPASPKLLGRIPTAWYPTGVAVTPDGANLCIASARGVGEDLNPKTDFQKNPTASGVESIGNSNFLFGSVQVVSLTDLSPAQLAADTDLVTQCDYAVHVPADVSVVPVGGRPSARIKHVLFILHENKTFDSMLGNLSDHFGDFASLKFTGASGDLMTASGRDTTLPAGTEYTTVSLNTQALATAFATGVNYFSDAEESDGGHQFSASGTASDYSEKTLLVKSGRGLLVNKNFEPEDYPEGGYIFNNAARNGVSFKDYGALIRITGSDTGTSSPSTIDDPSSGRAGYATAPSTNPLTEVPNSDVTSPTVGLGQAYFVKSPILAVLGSKNGNGEPHLDVNYPGYDFDISDQRRAREFIKDFDRMVKNNTLPTLLYIYQPNDHQGAGNNNVRATNIAQPTGPEEIADGDTALAMVVQHVMNSPVYYDSATNTGAAIFMTYDDAQSGHDHIDPHRTPLIVISPFSKPGFIAKRHYSTASIVKTEELLMGLPPNNYGDLFATDLRDMFQNTYNGITAGKVNFNTTDTYAATAPGRRIWKLASRLDSSGPDRDSHRLGAIGDLSLRADLLYRAARTQSQLHTASYRAAQARLYRLAERIVSSAAPVRDDDD